MRKKYIAPSMKVENVGADSLLAASMGLNDKLGGDELGQQYNGDASNAVNTTPKYNVWGDDEE